MNKPASLACLTVALIGWSLVGVFVKYMTWSSWAIAGWRSLFTAILLLAVHRAAFRNSAKLELSRSNWGIALSYSLGSTLFAVSIKLTTAANAILLYYTSIVYIALLSPLLLGEKTLRRDWFFIIPIGLGLSLFFLNDLETGNGRDDRLGILAGAACGFFWSLYIMLGRKKGREEPPVPAMILANCITVLYCSGAMAGVNFSADGQFGKNLGLAVILGLGPLGVSYIFYLVALKRVTALEIAVIMTIEPLLSPVWVFLVVGERPGFWTIVGGALVLALVLARSAAAMKTKR
jgi:drug/metabolite transporter (DMT)-like permease